MRNERCLDASNRRSNRRSSPPSAQHCTRSARDTSRPALESPDDDTDPRQLEPARPRVGRTAASPTVANVAATAPSVPTTLQQSQQARRLSPIGCRSAILTATLRSPRGEPVSRARIAADPRVVGVDCAIAFVAESSSGASGGRDRRVATGIAGSRCVGTIALQGQAVDQEGDSMTESRSTAAPGASALPAPSPSG